MTLDEAINKHIKMAELQERLLSNADDSLKEIVMKYAAEYRQLAEWLTELKELIEQKAEYKRLLKVAVEDMSEKNFCAKVCKRDNFACRVSDTCDFKWRHADEALKLIGDESSGI